MKKKIIWILVSGLMVLSLVMASCGPTAEEEKEVEVGKEEVEVGKEEVKVEEEEVVEEEEGLLPPEVPKYGGRANLLNAMGDPMSWDEGYGHAWSAQNTNEALIIGDWSKGLAGTGETDWRSSYAGNADLLTGLLAESWDIPDDETLIFHIRHGVHYYTNPESEACNLVGGREVTAEDVAFNLNRIYLELPKSTVYGYYKPEYKPISFTATDKYTLEIKTVPGQTWAQLRIAEAFLCYPPEVIEKYGDMKDWRNNCGTGPFILKDYVPGSSLTYIKNPDYWMHDPIHPENQLPYWDGLTGLIIPDRSTQLAALRAGKLDYMYDISRDELPGITSSNPNVITIKLLSEGMLLTGRCDKPELPFDDIRVRQALNLAVNKHVILDDYYGGHAEMLGPPYLNVLVQKDFYTPLEEQPSEPTIPGSRCSVQELFTYKPEKAKELLTEAGYPDGFTTEVTCTAANADYLSILKADLAKVNVTLDIKPVDSSIFFSAWFGRSYDMIFNPAMATKGVCHTFVMWRSDHGASYAVWEDPKVRDCFNKVQEVLHQDTKEMNRLLKEIGPYILEQAVSVWLPAPEKYTLYQPWLQNFHGESAFGMVGLVQWYRYLWIDTALKESLGY